MGKATRTSGRRRSTLPTASGSVSTTPAIWSLASVAACRWPLLTPDCTRQALRSDSGRRNSEVGSLRARQARLRTPPKAPNVIGVVELALAKVLGAERRSDEDERRAFDWRLA